MVYIDKNGIVLEKRPWDLNRILQILYAGWLLLLHFFSTLIAPFRTTNRGNSRSGNRRGGGWSSGGGGGGGGFGGDDGNGGPRPNRRIGRITNSMDCNIPGGGCSGGGCGG